jgi:hypothetical protein
MEGKTLSKYLQAEIKENLAEQKDQITIRRFCAGVQS